MELAAHCKLADTLDRGVAAMAAASAETLRAVAAYDERRLREDDGATSMSAWLAARYGLAKGTAREWVRVAHALRASGDRGGVRSRQALLGPTSAADAVRGSRV